MALGGRLTAQRFVLHVLRRRFGSTGDDLASLLEGLDLETLERLLDLAEEAPTLAAFRAGVDAVA